MFEQIIEKHKSGVYKMAYSLLKNKADADDVFQDVFLRYIKSPPKFSDEKHEEGWFIRTTVNMCNSFWRKARVRKHVNLEDFDGRYSQDFERGELLDAVLKLSPKLKITVHLYYYQGFSTKEIAQLLKIKESAVQTRLSQGRAKLSDFLGGS